MYFKLALKDFEDYHQKLSNRLYHYAGISLITIASLGLLDHITLASINLAVVVLLGTVVLDGFLCPIYAIPVLLFAVLFLMISKMFGVSQLLVIFALGWYCQLAGHRFAERNKPAFLQNLIHLYIGPRWMIIQCLPLFGCFAKDGNHLRINTDLPDILRWLFAKLMPWAGSKAQAHLQNKIKSQLQRQLALREEYKVKGTEPTQYSEELRARIVNLQATLAGSVFIYTSGSTSKPKQIIFNKERLKIFKATSALTAVQSFKLLKVTTPSMFVFASLQKDDSFASLVVTKNECMPGLLEGIFEPAKLMFHPLLKEALGLYGANAVRLWVICLTDPALFYATNPSTLAVFFNDLAENWLCAQSIFKDFVQGRGGFTDLLQQREWIRIIARMGRSQYGERMQRLAEADQLPDFSLIAPSLKGFVCWDGGYVSSFLRQITRYLPAEIYFHVPMFSMSTETLQTQAYIQDDRFHFIPLAERVLFEFFPESADKIPTDLLLGSQLEVGQSYIMVVSDPWGLRRYNTQDVFYCRSMVRGLPDLAFLKRAGLSYSFTGEKITGEQVEEAVEILHKDYPAIKEYSIQYTLVPSQPDQGLPHYVLLMAWVGSNRTRLELLGLADRFDHILSAINHEYRDKRLSQRLGALTVFIDAYDRIARHLDPKTRHGSDVQNRSWESQFKLTPLTQIVWQKIGLE